MRSPDVTDPDRAEPATWWSRIIHARPRPETLLLLLALAWTVAAKYHIVRHEASPDIAATLTKAILPDLIFFSAAYLAFALLYAIGRPRLAGRITVLAAGVITGWSVLNGAWLIATGVQLQPGVIAVLSKDPEEFWPTIRSHLNGNLGFAIPLVASIGGAGLWFVWRVVRPLRLAGSRRRHVGRVTLAGIALAVSLGGYWAAHGGQPVAHSGEVLGFSSHWYALCEVVSDVAGADAANGAGRAVPRVGERAIEPPDTPREALPNVVVILLESVSYEASSLDDPSDGLTPHLEQLAGEGVQFVSTYVSVPHTSKAFWATFTGCTPDPGPDWVESVLVDRPYESLASVLARRGYRSAFFEMSKGSFHCAPGVFENMDFDWAWFRENLGDPSAYLGSLNGDDFRLIEPMFEWVESEDAPFLLTMITTVAHDPYWLPDWYEHVPADDRLGRYQQAVRFSDDFVGAVLDALDERGLAENTIVAVLGDHGDSFRPGLKNGRMVPYEEVIRIPWVLRWPGRVDAGRRVELTASQLDLTPTILGLIGFDISEAGFDGRDLLRPDAVQRRHYFATAYRQSPVGFVEGSRKVVYWPPSDKLLEYDLERDPQERSPELIEGDERERLLEAIRTWERDSGWTFPRHRFRERVVFEHWRTWCTGRAAWAYFVP